MITVKKLGGPLPDGTELIVADSPSYEVGERVLLFLQPRDVDALSRKVENFKILGQRLGKFTITVEEAGTEFLRREDGDPALLLDQVVQYIAGRHGTGFPTATH